LNALITIESEKAKAELQNITNDSETTCSGIQKEPSQTSLKKLGDDNKGPSTDDNDSKATLGTISQDIQISNLIKDIANLNNVIKGYEEKMVVLRELNQIKLYVALKSDVIDVAVAK